MAIVVAGEFCKLLEQCLNKKLDNSEITVLDGNKKGDGYLGQIIFISIKNRNSSEEDNIIVKRQNKSDIKNVKDFITSCFFNEIHFYTKISPAIKNLRKSFPAAAQFEVAPKFYGFSNEPDKQTIILENLKIKNYGVPPLRSPISEDLYEKLFEVYARHHAESFALRHYEPKTFSDLVEPLKDNWTNMKDMGLLVSAIEDTANSIKIMLENMNRLDLLVKMQPFITNGLQVFLESFEYNGRNLVIKHGDCWSNNILVKYNDSNQVEDVKLIDFQLCYAATPVHDLTYSFYSGATKETLKNWRTLLKLYYETLSNSLKGYNLKAEKICPYEELEKEWKEYSRFGFLISLLMWGTRYLDEEEIDDINRMNKKDRHFYKKKEWVRCVMDLIEHYDENGFL